jgi:hypothetical protein
MAVVYTTAVKNARLDAVVTQIGATGVLEVGTAGMATVLFSVTLNNPAGTSSGGVLTFSGFPKTTTASASGTAAAGRIRTATGGTDIVTGLTVGTSSADIIVNTTTVATSDPVSVTSATITHAA